MRDPYRRLHLIHLGISTTAEDLYVLFHTHLVRLDNCIDLQKNVSIYNTIGHFNCSFNNTWIIHGKKWSAQDELFVFHSYTAIVYIRIGDTDMNKHSRGLNITSSIHWNT